MKAVYRREMKHNYLIMEPEENGYDSYEIHMMAANRIGGLLKFHVKQVDNQKLYYYEIFFKVKILQPLYLLGFLKVNHDKIYDLTPV